MKTSIYKNLVDGLKPLSDFWFAGVLVLLYIFLQYVIGLQGEQLEWMTWFWGFIFTMTILFLIIIKIIRPSLFFKFLLSLPFYLFLLSHWELTYAAFIFLAASVILWLGETFFCDNKGVQWQSAGRVLYYFVLFYIASMLIYWARFDDFIWLKVRETSNYYEYAQIIELVTPVLVLTIFFTIQPIFIIIIKVRIITITTGSSIGHINI